MHGDFKDLEWDGEEIKDVNKKAIINTNDDWPRWAKVVAAIVNALPVVLFFGVTFFLLKSFNSDIELAALRDGYLNVVVPAAAYNVLLLMAANVLLLWLNPYTNPRAMMKGSPLTQLAVCLYWGLSNIAVAIIIFGAS